MSDAAIGYTMIGLLVAVATLGGPIVLWRVERGSPEGITSRLRRTSKPIVCKSTGSGFWNPQGGTGSRRAVLAGAGIGTYSLTDDGDIQLVVQRPTGTQERYVGPAVERTPASRVPRRIAAIQVGLPVIGAVIGTLCVTGGPGTRTRAAIMGVIAGGLLGLAFSRYAARRLRRRSRDAMG